MKKKELGGVGGERGYQDNINSVIVFVYIMWAEGWINFQNQIYTFFSMNARNHNLRQFLLKFLIVIVNPKVAKSRQLTILKRTIEIYYLQNKNVLKKSFLSRFHKSIFIIIIIIIHSYKPNYLLNVIHTWILKQILWKQTTTSLCLSLNIESWGIFVYL